MKVALGEFACMCVASRFGSDLALGIQSATRHYSRMLASAADSGPRLRLPKPVEDPSVELEVALDREVLGRLESEARMRAVDLQQLLNHAIFVYLAELDRQF
jgi:hypothetical protein